MTDSPVSDPTPLREALADALVDYYDPFGVNTPDAAAHEDLVIDSGHAADAVIATLVEHRGQVLAALGMEQVGVDWLPCGVVHPTMDVYHPDGHPTGPLYREAAFIEEVPDE